MADKLPEGNSAQILRDIATRLKSGDVKEKEMPPSAASKEVEEEIEHRRFEILPSKPIEDDYLKHTTASSEDKDPKKKKLDDIKEKVRVTADNYRQLYMAQQFQETEMAEEKAKELQDAAKKKLEEANKKIAEERAANDYRYRAREIQNQIAWWKQQQGLGAYDDTVINTTVSQLASELAGIPKIYWP